MNCKFVTNIETLGKSDSTDRATAALCERAWNNKYKETTMAHFSLGPTTNCLGTDSTERTWRQVSLVMRPEQWAGGLDGGGGLA